MPFVAVPLTLAGFFVADLLEVGLPHAAAQQTLLEYSQPAPQPIAQPVAQPTNNAPAGSPYAPQTGRYGEQLTASAPNPYAAQNPYATAALPPSSSATHGHASQVNAGQAAPIAGTGNPFVRTGAPRSTLMNGSTNAVAADPRYGAMQPIAQPMQLQPINAQPIAAQPMTALPVDAASTRMRYDDQVRPSSFEVPPTTPMTAVAPATPVATVGGAALAVAPTNDRYGAQPDSRYAPADSRYAQSPSFAQSPQQQPTPTQGSPNIQTAANIPAQPTSQNVTQPLAHQPQQLTGLAILRQKPLDENAARQQHPLTPLVAWLEDSLRQMDAVRDYSCTFKKREFVDGKLGDQQSMFVKMRMQPYSVYFYFLDPSVQGQEALYVAGKNGGNLLAHPIGIKQTLVGTLSLAPNDPQAMDGNRYPITDFGFRRLAERYLERSKYEMQFGECDVRVIEGARVNDRTCLCVEVTHPVKRSEFRYHVCRIYIDNELNLPIRCEGYDWPERAGAPPQLIEEYTYSNLKLNINLTDADFDPANKQYGFK